MLGIGKGSMAIWGCTGLRSKSQSIMALIFALMAAVGTAVIAASTTDLLDYFGVNFVRKSALLHKERILSPIRRELALARKLADSAVIQEWMLNEDDPTLRRLAFAELRSYTHSFQEARKSVVEGKRVSGGVKSGGRRILIKKNKI